jgi:hypothetical protein
MITREVDWEPIRMTVVGDRCQHDPVCALVVATYEAEHWEHDEGDDRA